MKLPSTTDFGGCPTCNEQYVSFVYSVHAQEKKQPLQCTAIFCFLNTLDVSFLVFLALSLETKILILLTLHITFFAVQLNNFRTTETKNK